MAEKSTTTEYYTQEIERLEAALQRTKARLKATRQERNELISKLSTARLRDELVRQERDDLLAEVNRLRKFVSRNPQHFAFVKRVEETAAQRREGIESARQRLGLVKMLMSADRAQGDAMARRLRPQLNDDGSLS